MAHKFIVDVVAPKKGDYPFSPFCQIVVGSHWVDERGLHGLSPQLTTEQEIDSSFDYLSAELEIARSEAKKGLKRAKDQLHSDLSARILRTS